MSDETVAPAAPKAKPEALKVAGIDTRSSLCKSFQGEGPYAGQRIVVLRVMGCNLACNWLTASGRYAICDTAWTWDGTAKGTDFEVEKLVQRIVKESKVTLPQATWEKDGYERDAKIVMVTGGEPLLRQKNEAFQALIEGLCEEGFAIHFETNGTQEPSEWLGTVAKVVVLSPKYQLYQQKYPDSLIGKWQAFGKTTGIHLVWKFVVGRMTDIEELREWLVQKRLAMDSDIWLLPLTEGYHDGIAGRDMGQSMDILRSGADEAFRIAGYPKARISPRLQISGGFA